MKDINLKQTIMVILLAFAGLCFISSFFLNQNKQASVVKELPAQGGIIGPINVDRDKSVFQIQVKQAIPQDFQANYIATELLDKDQEYLMSFGREFYRESGYDSDGYWSESVTSYRMKFTIPKKGTYYLSFAPEKVGLVTTPIKIKIEQKRASALPFFILGLLLVIGVVVPEIAANWKEAQ